MTSIYHGFCDLHGPYRAVNYNECPHCAQERQHSGSFSIQQGCVCPPTSEKTCQNPTCPRKPSNATIGARHIAETTT